MALKHAKLGERARESGMVIVNFRVYNLYSCGCSLASPCKNPNARLVAYNYIQITHFMMQLSLLRHPVLQRSLSSDPSVAGEANEIDRRRIGRALCTEGRHIRVPVLPLATLPHHVHS